MNVRSLLILFLTVLPWVTAPLIKKAEWKRFYPALLFITLFMTIEGFIAYKRKWWEFPKGTILHYLKDSTYVVGPFFIGTLWILKLTYGNFKKYMLVNGILDSGFVYVLMITLKKFNIMKLVNLKKYQFMSLFIMKCLSIYGFQMLIDKLRVEWKK